MLEESVESVGERCPPTFVPSVNIPYAGESANSNYLSRYIGFNNAIFSIPISKQY